MLYPGATALDLIGPLQVLAALDQFGLGFRTVVVAEHTSPMATDTPAGLTASHTFAEVPEPHLVLVPGGVAGTYRAMADPVLLDYLRVAARTARFVTSVCTGSLVLAAAGLLEGRRATTHWTQRDLLAKFGATPVAERWVDDGQIITAAGVSAGIDLALHLVERLAGAKIARQVQLFVEYDPQPPHGPLDWSAVDIPSYRPMVAGWIGEALADHPELRDRLLA
ncbi:DJ-1/PfpI family protein [Solihabitans fulvus]|uniref:DJ-1/PfpI family protein n=1 Tax=Solihabitans fulvus TaxID=1892852 RepID=A0A5B2WVR4_9PSEU|nr:DJ-1/PfpI family protein [Solihabitans fulvus]